MANRRERAAAILLRISLVFAMIAPLTACRGADADAARADRVAGRLIVFNDNGAWSWFQDERAIVHGGTLIIIGSVADASGTGGAARDGNVEVTTYDLATSAIARRVYDLDIVGILLPGSAPR